MKDLIKQFAITIFLVLVVAACSKNDDDEVIKPDYALKGTFTLQASLSVDPTVLLFENSRVFYAYEANSIHQTLASGGNLKNQSVPFTLNPTTKEIKFTLSGKEWSGFYDPETGKIRDGKIRNINNNTSEGNFTAVKQFQTNTGLDLLKGHWKGSFGFGQNTPSENYSLIIEDGQATVVTGAMHILEENYPESYGLSLNAPVIQNNKIATIYQFIGGETCSLWATYNPDTKKLEGTWGRGTNYTDGGTFILVSQNQD